jgi:hypothetical protein
MLWFGSELSCCVLESWRAGKYHKTIEPLINIGVDGVSVGDIINDILLLADVNLINYYFCQ